MGKAAQRFIAGIVCACMLGCCLDMSAQSSFEQRYSQAQRFYSEGRYSEAILILEASLEGVGLSDSQSASAKALMSKCTRQLEDYQNRPVAVTISSSPADAKISIDGSSEYLSPFTASLKPGRHGITIEKEGYAPMDTVIVIGRDGERNPITLHTELTPLFASLRLTVEPEDGYSFTMGPEAEVAGHSYDLSKESPGKIEGDEVRYYQMYEGGLLFVPQGAYVIILTAEGFNSKVLNLNLMGGDERDIAVRLAAKKGIIQFSCNGKSDGATILLDGEKIGVLPMESVTVPSGTHTLSYVKDGFMTAEDSYNVSVPDGGTAHVWVSMSRFRSYDVTSDIEGATIILDGKEAGRAPATIDIPEGKHRIMAKADGFYNGEIAIKVNPDEPGNGRLTLDFVPMKTVSFSTDRVDTKQLLYLYTLDNHVLAEGATIPCSIRIPESDRRFNALVLSDISPKRAYKGPVRLAGNEESHTIRSFSKLYTQWLGADVSPNGFKASVLKFSPLPFAGLSTSALKAGFQFGDGLQLNSITCLLLNWEFRVGGSLTESLDAGIIGAFSFYPDLSSWLGMPIKSGEELFLGAEISSRIPYVNANIKAGVEYFYGTRFVVSLGISLGGKNSKGNCYLRF